MFTSPLFWQIRFLVSSLTKKNFKSNISELNQLIEAYGEDAQAFLLTCLIEETNLKDPKAQNQQKDIPKVSLLHYEIAQALQKPNIVSTLCQALGASSKSQAGGPGNPITEEFIGNFCRALNLNTQQQITVAASLAQSPNTAVAQEAYKFLRSKIQEFATEGGGHLPSQTLHSVLVTLRINEEYISNPKATSVLIKMLKATHPDYASAFPLLPLMDEEGGESANYAGPENGLRNSQSEAGGFTAQIRYNTDMADLIRDMGYSCTASADVFREAIKETGCQMDERQAAGIISLVAATHTGLASDISSAITTDLLSNGESLAPGAEAALLSEASMPLITWNLEAIATVLREYPNLNWAEVAMKCDQPNFYIPDQKGLKAFLSLYKACSGSDFPLDALFKIWENNVGHLSLLQQAIAAPPEVISFEGSPHLQEPFDDLPEISTGTSNKAWQSLDLISTLLCFADTSLVGSVRQLFEWPIRNCPELLVCGLASLDNSWNNKLKTELLGILLPNFFKGRPPQHAVAVVKRIWSVNQRLMVDACMEAFRSEETVAVVMNTLAIMLLIPESQQHILNSPDVEFVTAIASAASDRDSLNLEMFLMERMKAVRDKDLFVSKLLNFIRKHAPNSKSKNSGEQCILSVESLAIILKCLQSDAAVVQGPLGAEIKQVVELCSKSFPEAGEPSSPDVIEEMANSYFQKIYTSEQSISEVIEMLKRFKTSKDVREQEIFACMIRNLFDEYRFFHKYPEKELRITGILFGTLVQHQLVASLTLGVALRYVLEALRRPPGNGTTGKWFRFGMYALEQFKGRLYEWPQYCSHIVTIPHLRQQYPELVAEIERAMVRDPATIEADQAALQAQGGARRDRNPLPMFDKAGGEAFQQKAPYGGEGMSRPEVGSPSLHASPTQGPAMGQFAAGQGIGQVPIPQQLQPQQPQAPQPPPSGLAPAPPQTVLNTMGMVGRTAVVEGSPTLEGSPVLEPQRAMPPSHSPLLQAQSPLEGARPREAPGGEAQQREQAVPVPPQPQHPLGPDGQIIINIEKIMPHVVECGPGTAPSDNVVEKVLFIINNVAQGNVDQKASEMKEILKEENYPWMAHYMVHKRISCQANLHPLLLTFLDKIDAAALLRAIMDHVLLYISKLLKSNKIVVNTGERSVLKNLGSWLGQMTIARNKPLLQRQLDLKELLYHGYETGRLFAVTPCVAKIVEWAGQSKVFRPPNPWIMGLMGVMAELYLVEGLKSNIKFEIDLLCKKLDLKIQDVPHGDTLRKRIQPRKEKNQDFQAKQAPHQGMVSPPQQPAVAPEDMKLEGDVNLAQMQNQDVQGGQAIPPQMDGQGQGANAPPNFQEQTVIPNLGAYVSINPGLNLFNQSPQLKRLVPVAVDRAIREIIQPVVERSVTIACITTKELIVKDFATESDENKMRRAAHLMVSNLAGSLALVTCKEPLRVSMGNHLRSLLQQAGVDPSIIDTVVQTCARDNLEIGCMLIEKAATEKAMRDVDEALSSAVQQRRKHRETSGQPFFDTNVFANTRYPAALPEPLRPKQGGLTQAQLDVYEAFQRTPRQMGARPAQGMQPGMGAGMPQQKGPDVMPQPANLPQALESFEQLVNRLDGAIHALGPQAQGITLNSLGPEHEITSAIRDIVVFAKGLHIAVKEDVAFRAANVIFKMLYDPNPFNAETLRIEAFVAVLDNLSDISKKIKQDLPQWAFGVNVQEAQKKIHRTVLLVLIRHKLIKTTELDVYLAKNMDTGRNAAWVEFSIPILRAVILGDRGAPYQEFKHSLEILQKTQSRQAPPIVKEITYLLTEIQKKIVKPPGPVGRVAGPQQRQERQEVAYLLEHWLVLWNESPGSEKAYLQYFAMLQQHDIMKSPDSIEKFIRIATDVCVEACLKNAAVNDSDELHRTTLQYGIVDTYAKLLFQLVKYYGDITSRVNILARILKAIVSSLREDVEARKSPLSPFDPRPYFRLFLDLLHDFNAFDPTLDSTNFQVLTAFAFAFNRIQPAIVPGFAFAWLELISHRMFMPSLLLAKQGKGWTYMHKLLMDLFRFLEPFLRKAELNDPIRILYKGTLRVLLVLLHDFPEFLCDYHFSFCDVIPTTCIQLRNLILSAFPRNMRLPDPFTPNLKVDLLPEISQSPRILADYVIALQDNSLKQEIDVFLKARQPQSFEVDLPGKLRSPDGNGYNIPAINALVIYVGIQAIAQFQAKSNTMPAITHSAPMDIFRSLMNNLDSEGRYYFLNAIANQLRYPNNQTHYFSCVVLYLFAEANSELVQEQITRVLLERLIVHRPHPWGLLITFIELIKNPRYNFWNHSFTHCATEIERVFESVARSCMGQGCHVTPGGGGMGEEAKVTAGAPPS